MIKEKIVQSIRPIKTIEDWRRLNKKWESSGTPQKLFCKEHDIPYATFVYWRSKIVQAPSGLAKKIAFQEIKAPTYETSLPINSKPTINISLPGNIAITIPIGVEERVLTILFKSLKGIVYA